MTTTPSSPEVKKPKRITEWLVFGLVALGVCIGIPLYLSQDENPAEAKGVVTIEPGLGVEFRGQPPVELNLPSLKKKFPVKAVKLTKANQLVPPSDAEVMGWWSRSAKPGSNRGQAVYTAHSLREGGPNEGLNGLNRVELDEKVVVKTKTHAFTYRILRMEKIARDQVVYRQKEFFGQEKGGKDILVLITCEDWKDGDWQNNLFVFAELVKTKKL